MDQVQHETGTREALGAAERQRQVDAAWAEHARRSGFDAPPISRAKTGQHGERRRPRIIWSLYRPDLLERLSEAQNHRCCHCGQRTRLPRELAQVPLAAARVDRHLGDRHLGDRHLGDRHLGDRATFEHAVPLANGGADEVENLLMACLTCNVRRGNDETWRPTSAGTAPII